MVCVEAEWGGCHFNSTVLQEKKTEHPSRKKRVHVPYEVSTSTAPYFIRSTYEYLQQYTTLSRRGTGLRHRRTPRRRESNEAVILLGLQRSINPNSIRISPPKNLTQSVRARARALFSKKASRAFTVTVTAATAAAGQTPPQR